MDAIDKGHVLTEVAKASLIAIVGGVISLGFKELDRLLTARRERAKDGEKK